MSNRMVLVAGVGILLAFALLSRVSPGEQRFGNGVAEGLCRAREALSSVVGSTDVGPRTCRALGSGSAEDERAATGRQHVEIDAGATTKRIEGPTPNGGAYAIAYYRDRHGNAVAKAEALNVEIVEYDAHGKAVYRTYGEIAK